MAAGNRVEKLELKDQFKNILEEARIILPGIQAIFGFQLIAVFNQQFSKVLSADEQRLHFLATAFMSIAVVMAMAPSAIHRQSQPDCVSTRLVKLATFLIAGAMVPLALGLSIDAGLLAKIIFQDPALGKWVGAGLLTLAALAWYVVPVLLRAYLNQPTEEVRLVKSSDSEAVAMRSAAGR